MMLLIESPPSFIQWLVGQIGAAVTILIALFSLHQSNKKRIKDDAITSQELYHKVDELYRWIRDNGPDLITMQAKVNLMYDIWFKGGEVKKSLKSEGD